jgi:hypothetical protein
VSGDVFLTATNADGSFSYALPPGLYELREERGPVVAGYIAAQGEDITLGTVSEPPSIMNLLQSEAVAPAQIRSPAPITSSVVPGGPVGEEKLPAPGASPIAP